MVLGCSHLLAHLLVAALPFAQAPTPVAAEDLTRAKRVAALRAQAKEHIEQERTVYSDDQLQDIETDERGDPVKAAWVLIVAADRMLRRPWATTSHALQTDERGEFRVASLPGDYLVRALPWSTFQSKRSALEQIDGFARGAVPVGLGDRELKRLTLTVTEP